MENSTAKTSVKRDLQYKSNDKLRRIIILVGILVLITLTILFRITDWDIAITAAFYNPALPLNSRFFLSDAEPWNFFYENEKPLLAITLVVGLLMFLVGLVKKDKRDFIKYGLFILFVVLIGPGLIVNVIFKGEWGRPRPRDTIIFGGTDPFYRVWDPAFIDGMDGASFSSGHPCALLSTIAIFLAFNHPEYIVKYFGTFKPWKIYMLKFIKNSALIVSFFGGLLMGIGRIIQGAHFASDVLWSYGFVYLTAALLYYVVFNIPKWERSQIPK
jgi:lipid A 4'-phosphatase